MSLDEEVARRLRETIHLNQTTDDISAVSDVYSHAHIPCIPSANTRFQHLMCLICCVSIQCFETNVCSIKVYF